jgi:UDP-glucose 4-epimerase
MKTGPASETRVKLEGKRILVTGGAGFIGSHLVEDLAQDNQVTVFDDFSVGEEENLASVADRITVRRGDVANAAEVEQAVRGHDVVFHLAVVCLRAVINDPMLGHRVNELGTLNVLLSARANDVQRFIYCSSSEVYGTAQESAIGEDHPLSPQTPYAAGKLGGEAQALSFWRTYGLPVTVVRPFNTYGPRAHLEGASGEVIPKFVARAMAQWPLVVFGDGLQTRDFTWVSDVARGIRMAAAYDGLVGDRINIARGEEVSILQLAELVREVTGQEVIIENRPDRPGDVRRHLASVARSHSLLGFSAHVDIREGLQRYVEWVREMRPDPLVWLQREEVLNWMPAQIAD